MINGKILRKLRKERKLTTREVGIFIGKSQQYISDIETGRSNPSLETISKLAKYFKVTIDYLLEENCLNILNDKDAPVKSIDFVNKEMVFDNNIKITKYESLTPEELEEIIEFFMSSNAGEYLLVSKEAYESGIPSESLLEHVRQKKLE
jgi:transcriptional regulator with XRE-family HTH domain